VFTVGIAVIVRFCEAESYLICRSLEFIIPYSQKRSFPEIKTGNGLVTIAMDSKVNH